MAHTKINTQVIPDGTIVSADLTMPITGFSSTGIDDNATSNALTINSSGDVAISGNLTAGNNTDISMGATAPGQLKIDGVGYGGAIALDSTGMYIYHNSGSRSLLFGTNETERMRITSAGNVAVATTQDFQSGQKLAVGDGSSNSGITVYSGSASQGRLYFASATTGAGQRAGQIYYDHSNNSMTVSTNGDNPRISVLQNGNVGIGTSSPQETLHVYTTGNTRAEIESTVGIAAFKATNNQGSYAWYVDANADKFHLFDFTDSVDRMTLDGSGNVGIGTTNPLNKFVVAESTGNHGIELAPGTTSYIQAYDRATSDYGDLKIDAQIIIFGTDNGSERMRIDATGTVSMTEQLDVAGPLTVDDGTSGYIKGPTGEMLIGEDTSGLYIGYGYGVSPAIPFRYGSPATTYHGFNAGGSERMRIDSAGRVLINQTSPDESLNLEVMAPTGFSVGSGFHSGSTQSTISFKDTNTTADYKVRIGSEGDELLLFAGGSARMRIDSSGRVGIGGGTSSNGMLTIESTSTNHINLQAGNTAVNGRLLVSHSSTGAFIRTASGSSGTCDNLKFGTSLSERMRIDSSGNVGIGTTAPGRRLDVSSTQQAIATFGSSSTTRGLISFTDANTSGNTHVMIGATGNDLKLYAGGSTERMTIKSSGNVGIGDFDPTRQLHVKSPGTGDSRNLLVDTTGANGNAGIGFASGGNEEWSLATIGTTGAQDLRLYNWNNTEEVLRVSDSGNVGIGTDSPAGILHTKSTDYGVVFQSDQSAHNRMQLFFQDYLGSATGRIAVDKDGDGANAMSFNTGSSEAMRINTAGTVAIGTTTPSLFNKLHVEGGIFTGARGTIHSHYDGAIRWIKIFERHYLSSSSFNYGQHNILVMQAGATNGHGSAARIHVTSKQQGTSNVFDIQYVDCSGEYYTDVAYKYDATGGNNSAGLLTIWAKTATTYMQMSVTSDTSGSLGLDKSGNIMAINTSSILQPLGSTLLTPNLRLETAGSVGLGSNSPDGQLHIKGSTNKTLKLDPTFSSGSYTSLAFARNGNDLWRVFQTSSDSYLSFYNEQGSQHQLTLENSGNIGINETNPYSPLHIEKITETASYTATSFNSQPTIMLRHTSATGGYNGTRYTNSAGNYEWFTGAVQTGANTADFVFQGYNRTAGAYQEHLRISEEGHLFIGRTSYTNAATDHGTQLYNNGVIYQFSASTGNSDVYRWHNGSGTKIGYLQGDGDLFLSGTVKAQGGLQSGLGRAYSNVGVTGYNRMPVGHYTPGETVFEIDPTWSSSQLQDYFNLTSGACDWVEDSTAPGGYAIKITGNRSVAGNYNAGFPYIPVDQDDIFYMECWIKTTGGGTVRHYMGSIDYSHTFASLGGNPGSFGYWVMSNTAITTAMGWTKVSGYITGFGNSVGQFESGTKYWTPQALFNYTLNSGTRESYISGWKVIRVRSPGNRTFANDVTVNGTLSKTSGSFKIDHPLPSMTDTHHLVHSFIEGPRADLIYSDTIQLTNGAAIVNIDEYATMTEGTFEALCASVRCFTSNEDTWDAVKGSVTGNILTIECQNVSSNAFVSWMVIGERKDPSMMSTDWTNDNGRVIVEPEKVSEVLNAEYLEAPDPETANTD